MRFRSLIQSTVVACLFLAAACSYASAEQAYRDKNNVPSLLGASAVAGSTETLRVLVNASGALYVSMTASTAPVSIQISDGTDTALVSASGGLQVENSSNSLVILKAWDTATAKYSQINSYSGILQTNPVWLSTNYKDQMASSPIVPSNQLMVITDTTYKPRYYSDTPYVYDNNAGATKLYDFYNVSMTATAGWSNNDTASTTLEYYYAMGTATASPIFESVYINSMSSLESASDTVPIQVALLGCDDAIAGCRELFTISCDLAQYCKHTFTRPFILYDQFMDVTMASVRRFRNFKWRVRLSAKVGTATSEVRITASGFTGWPQWPNE